MSSVIKIRYGSFEKLLAFINNYLWKFVKHEILLSRKSTFSAVVMGSYFELNIVERFNNNNVVNYLLV